MTGTAVTIALQPIVHLGTGNLAGAEALARFSDRRSPEEWFRAARRSGRVRALERRTFTLALRLFDELPEHCYLSVNAGVGLLTEEGFGRWLIREPVPHERLVVEITEHAQVADYNHLHACLAPLREHGVRLAVDDTGAGYASMHHVLQLRPDVIKIDRSLITNVTSDAARRALITAFVLLALELDATVAAEGIERPSELETLAALGVDCGQGYLLGRPSTDRAHWRAWCDRNWLRPEHGGDPRRQAVGAPVAS